MVKFIAKRKVQDILKQLRQGGFEVEGKAGWYKAYDGKTQVLQQCHIVAGHLCAH